MNLIGNQDEFETIRKRAQSQLQKVLPNVEGDFAFIGIKTFAMPGAELWQQKETVDKSKGIVLFLANTRFKNDHARFWTPNIKFFIDGVEAILGRNVLVVGCYTDKTRKFERYILNKDRWPHRQVETPKEAIPVSETVTESKEEI